MEEDATTATQRTSPLPSAEVVLDLLPDAVCIVDADSRLLYASSSFERIFGYTSSEILGRKTFEFMHPEDVVATERQVAQIMEGDFQRHFRNRYRHKDGHFVDIQWSARWHPEHQVRIAVAHEVTELRNAERKLEHLATHDPLTGLANRHYLQKELRQVIERAQASNQSFALLYIDLDGFKAVNDHCGHEAGDALLCEVADRLRQIIREGDLAARVGGDEFVVLLPNCENSGAAKDIGQSLRKHLQSHIVPDCSISVDASIGIAMFPLNGHDPNTLMAFADKEMFAVKRHERRHDHSTIQADAAGPD